MGEKPLEGLELFPEARVEMDRDPLEVLVLTVTVLACESVTLPVSLCLFH